MIDERDIYIDIPAGSRHFLRVTFDWHFEPVGDGSINQTYSVIDNLIDVQLARRGGCDKLSNLPACSKIKVWPPPVNLRVAVFDWDKLGEKITSSYDWIHLRTIKITRSLEKEIEQTLVGELK